MTPWTTSTLVKQYALVKWDSLNYLVNPPTPFGNEAAFDGFLVDYLIPAAQGHIKAYCSRDFDVEYVGSTLPEAIQDICARAAANMIQYLVMNKMGPLIRTGDYQLSIPDQSVLTPDLRQLLAPWRLQRTGHVVASSYKTHEIRRRWDEE